MDSRQGSNAEVGIIPEPPGESSLRHAWRAWGDVLRLRHLDGLTAVVLEIGRPLALVSAQFLHIGGPVLGESARHLAELLESEDETAKFIDYLDHRSNGGSGGHGVTHD